MRIFDAHTATEREAKEKLLAAENAAEDLGVGDEGTAELWLSIRRSGRNKTTTLYSGFSSSAISQLRSRSRSCVVQTAKGTQTSSGQESIQRCQFDSVDPAFLETEEDIAGISAADFKNKKPDFFKTFLHRFSSSTRVSSLCLFSESLGRPRKRLKVFTISGTALTAGAVLSNMTRRLMREVTGKHFIDRRLVQNLTVFSLDDKRTPRKEDTAKIRGIIDLTPDALLNWMSY
ncbi:hypothetical protein C0995_004409 [Termitomyces sp. Mi166|nr:hypothetical protein C0995_004409 [Termitomyces sp. Mi166\